jgi:hypothetical protein
MALTPYEYDRLSQEHPDSLLLERAAYNVPYIF